MFKMWFDVVFIDVCYKFSAKHDDVEFWKSVSIWKSYWEN